MQPPAEIDSSSSKGNHRPSQSRGWLVTVTIIGIVTLLCLVLWFSLSKRTLEENPAEEKNEDSSATIELEHDTPGLVLVTVSNKAPSSTFSVAGTIEPNQQQLQQITPLVSGRIENIFVALGDNVKPGTLLLSFDSPQVAELHGKLHEAETKLRLATINLNRVQQAANRVSILKAKATLDEAESTLKRTKQLVSEGLTARKDVVAAQSEYERSLADYNFQKDISLNREVTEAKATLQTAETEAEHIRDGLKALDARLGSHAEGPEHQHDISKIELRSPIAGTVIERFVNSGAGFEQGKPLLTIANTSVLWVIANIPENLMPQIHIGSPAKVLLGSKTVTGTVSYIDPRLNEDTRTSRVRIEIVNPAQKIQIGAFTQVEFIAARKEPAALFVPEAAIQTVEGKTVVFVHDKASKFSLRNVKIGTASSGYVPILSGLSLGEEIAANGSFILKSKLLKQQFGDQD
ncbi:MAG: efflux RND transporter periplasmic adaptor subunit [Candidatus Obscuribacterales bacterium]|nr:efflux RND transporter periplasmic adaptor subunit [Candidatus Obscuribacterales bacterium]